MNCRIASSVAGDVGFAAMEVEARADEVEDGKLTEEMAEEETEDEEVVVVVGGGRGRWSRRKRMLPPVRKSEMCDVWKRSIIFWYLFSPIMPVG